MNYLFLYRKEKKKSTSNLIKTASSCLHVPQVLEQAPRARGPHHLRYVTMDLVAPDTCWWSFWSIGTMRGDPLLDLAGDLVPLLHHPMKNQQDQAHLKNQQDQAHLRKEIRKDIGGNFLCVH